MSTNIKKNKNIKNRGGMGLEVREVNEKGVTLKVDNDIVYFIGNIDSRQPGELMSQFFVEVPSQLVSKSFKEVNVDITQLQFLNSSGIKELAKWIMTLNSTPEDKKYKIGFICDKNLVWQDTSISTLTLLNPDYIGKSFINK